MNREAETYPALTGIYRWYVSQSRALQPAPPPPAAPTSAIGRRLADVVAKMRDAREGDAMRQASTPRRPRKPRSGDLSLTVFGKVHKIGPRNARKALHALGILQLEIEVRGGWDGLAPEYARTLRLTPDSVSRGLGRRILPRSGAEYDVLTRKGQAWAEKRLLESVPGKRPSRRYKVRNVVRDMLGQGLAQAEIVRRTGLSRQIVSHHARRLAG